MSLPAVPAAWVASAVGESTRTVRRGAPTRSAGAVSVGLVQLTNVPGPSTSGSSWPPTAEVSEYDVGAGPVLA